ncbi:MAG: putative glycoside hydrolase [Treponema sp.]
MKRLFILLFCLITVSAAAQDFFLAGTRKGLYQVTPASLQKIWDSAGVRKIIKTETAWFFLTDDGVFKSDTLTAFESRNEGLPVKVLKKLHGSEKVFIRKTQMLKDLEVHPDNPDILITATNSTVFLSRDGGAHWQSVGCHTAVNGIKAVCVLDLPDAHGRNRLTVLASHAIYGAAWKQPDVSDTWQPLAEGLTPGPESDEEISDITVQGYRQRREVYAAQTFTSKLYRLDWQTKRFHTVSDWTEGLKDARCLDGLASASLSLIGCKNGGLFEVPLFLPVPQPGSRLTHIELRLKHLPDQPLSAWFPHTATRFGKDVSLSELWLLNEAEKTQHTEYLRRSAGRKGVYMPAHQARTAAGLQKYFDLLERNKLDTLVIDMKDDYGFIRYDSQDEQVQAVGAVRPFVRLEAFTAEARKRNLYLVARIVVFKDKQLYRYQNGRYAVKDRSGRPWQGYKTGRDGRIPIEEHWVDPYNEGVWEYNAAVAQELVQRGFDEIQFDYIRFPTDGENLYEARYPAQEQGMDKESALMSFLAYARAKIKAPLSIDIYGANGWYRTGARTGQEVELLADYVDVICPMFYPSHFRQSFLAYKPAQERPYRIYYWGSYRNKMIARNRVIVRPWTQAFYIPVSYDKKFYDADYVQRQIIGIKDSIDEGYVYWNNSGRYDDIRPDGLPLPD